MKDRKINIKILSALVTITALAATACSNDEIIANQKGKAIDFKMITEKESFRANETTSQTISDFTVSAHWKAAGNEMEPFTPNFMYSIEVKKISNSWVYSPVHYYPTSGIIDFYVYSPAQSHNTSNFSINAIAPVITYVVPSANDLQEDFLAAKAEAKYDTINSRWENVWENDNIVHLLFKHTLAKVEFRVRNDAEDVKFIVGGITIANLQPKGSYHLARQEWFDITGTDTHYSIDMAGPIILDYDVNNTINDIYEPLSGNLMLLPQLIKKGSVALLVNYAAIDSEGFPLYGKFNGVDSKGNPVVTDYYTASIPLEISKIDSENRFEAGKQYLFCLKFGANLQLIDFNFSINNWDNIPGIISN
jgi:hypothetical protein